MAKNKEEENKWIPVTTTCTDITHWAVHYTRTKQGKWIHERLGANCEKTIKSLVKKWEQELDSHGVYMGTIKGNNYPDIVNYDELNSGVKVK